MPFESAILTGAQAVHKALATEQEYFRYCTFSNASLEGGHFDGVFIACIFKDMEWYWGLFNTAIFVDCTFENCIFRGSSFAGCRIVQSSFEKTRFLKDNLGAPCSSSETSVYDCRVEDCEGVEDIFPTLMA